jgi:hypothetical protein
MRDWISPKLEPPELGRLLLLLDDDERLDDRVACCCIMAATAFCTASAFAFFTEIATTSSCMSGLD